MKVQKQQAETVHFATYRFGVGRTSVNKSILPWCLCTVIMAVVQLNGPIELKL